MRWGHLTARQLFFFCYCSCQRTRMSLCSWVESCIRFIPGVRHLLLALQLALLRRKNQQCSQGTAWNKPSAPTNLKQKQLTTSGASGRQEKLCLSSTSFPGPPPVQSCDCSKSDPLQTLCFSRQDWSNVLSLWSRQATASAPLCCSHRPVLCSFLGTKPPVVLCGLLSQMPHKAIGESNKRDY